LLCSSGKLFAKAGLKTNRGEFISRQYQREKRKKAIKVL